MTVVTVHGIVTRHTRSLQINGGLRQTRSGTMTKQTSILTDIELGAVAGGSMITDMAAAGIQRGARRVAESKGEGKCPPNHNGVR